SVLLIPARADLGMWGWVILEIGPHGFSGWVTVLPQPLSTSTAQPAASSAAARAALCPSSICTTQNVTLAGAPLLAVDQRIQVDVVDPHPGVAAKRREAEADVPGERRREAPQHADRRRRRPRRAGLDRPAVEEPGERAQTTVVDNLDAHARVGSAGAAQEEAHLAREQPDTHGSGGGAASGRKQQRVLAGAE